MACLVFQTQSYFPTLHNHLYPLCLVGDEAFPLKMNMLRPYPGKNLSEDLTILNSHLSRARKIIENAFGKLAATYMQLFIIVILVLIFTVINSGGKYFGDQ